jgi:nitrate/nitrite transporter NarK
MDLTLLIAALVVSIIIFTLLINVVKATLKTALTIALIILVLQLFFGIGPGQLWQQINQLFQSLWNLVTGRR